MRPAASYACDEHKDLWTKMAQNSIHRGDMVATWRQNEKKPAVMAGRNIVQYQILVWLRGQDLNLRPSGYEPDELPGCSTPRHRRPQRAGRSFIRLNCRARYHHNDPDRRDAASPRTPQCTTAHWPRVNHGRKSRAACFPRTRIGKHEIASISRSCFALGRPGGDLLSRALRQSTIGAGAFHGRVRNGNGCSRPAITTRSAKRKADEKLVGNVCGANMPARRQLCLR